MPIFFRFNRSVPLSTLALLFLALILGLLGLTTLFFVTNLSLLEKSFVTSNERLARQEIVKTMALIEKHMMKTAEDFAQWDESRQQLQDPSYYAYWRNARLQDSGLLSPALDGIELYDIHGKTLSREIRSGDEAMPKEVPRDALHPRFEHKDGHDHIMLFRPIHLSNDPGKLLGYIGMKFDFLDALKNQYSFRYADLSSIVVNAESDQSVPFAQAIDFLSYKSHPNPEVQALKSLLFKVLFIVAGIMTLGILLAHTFVVTLVARPLRRISAHIDALRLGGTSFIADTYRGPIPISELENVCHSLNDYQHKLEQMHVNLADKNEELWKLAHHDPLTGVHNRRAFDEDWGAILNLSPNMTLNISFVLFDCDHFKSINDTYGHHIGDKIIQGIANSLHQALRAGDRLYRLGGDEFATILFETDAALAQRVAERCDAAIKNHDFAADGMREPVSISIGVAHTRDTSSAPLLHKQADLAMYHAKRPGNSKITMYTPELGMENLSVYSSPETAAIYAAINNPEKLEMHYQKIVSLPDEKTEYFEALVRIPHDHYLLSPAHIFSVVEAKRLETEFDLAVLSRIRMDLDLGLLPPHTGISINVSGMSIVNATVIDRLLTFSQYLRLFKIVIEVTETSLITQLGHATNNLNQLRKAGFSIALDDFGSGYSSLRYLSTMPVDLVKFDISMIQCLSSEDRQKTIVENLAQLIRTAGFGLVAEGIETNEALARVKALGFSHAQGYLLGRPERLEE